MRTGGEVAGFPAFIVSSEAEFVKACSEKTRFFRQPSPMRAAARLRQDPPNALRHRIDA